MKTKYTFLLAILVLVNLELAASDNGNSHDPRWRYRYRPAPMPFCGVPRVRVFIPPPPPPFVTTYVHINRPYRPNPAPVPIETQIRYYKEDIQNQKFESDKLRVAKEGAMDLPLYSVDVLDIMNLFTYESSRLEFAKFAYNKVNDKDKYSIIYQAFKFDSSLRDFEDYIYNGR